MHGIDSVDVARLTSSVEYLGPRWFVALGNEESLARFSLIRADPSTSGGRVACMRNGVIVGWLQVRRLWQNTAYDVPRVIKAIAGHIVARSTSRPRRIPANNRAD